MNGKGKSLHSPSIVFTLSFVIANLCSSLAFALVSAVFAALDVANVDIGCHGLGESGAEVGGSCRGRRLNSS